MKTQYVVSLTLLGVMTIVGCQRANERNASSVIIQVPESGQTATSSVGVLTLPTNRKACYGVSITAPDINSHSASCSPNTGIVSGFVESGGTLEASVPRGTNRKIELFLYLQPEGADNPCPAMGSNMSGSNFLSTYLVGTASGINLQKDVESVTITASFPGLANNIAQQFNMPTSCLPSSDRKSSANVSSAQGTIVGGGMRLVGKVGRAASTPTTIGGGIKIKPKSGQ
jgi:hypothetical protein